MHQATQLAKPVEQTALSDGEGLYKFTAEVALTKGGSAQEVEWWFRALAHHYIPKPPSAPALAIKQKTADGYSLEAEPPGNCRGINIKISPTRIQLTYLSDSPEIPQDEFFQGMLSLAAYEVLMINNWDTSPVKRLIMKTWTYQELNAKTPYHALLQLIKNCERTLLEAKAIEEVQLVEDTDVSDADMAESLNTAGGQLETVNAIIGSSWMRLELQEDFFAATTLYFYPGGIQIVCEQYHDAPELTELEEIIEVAKATWDFIATYFGHFYHELADAREKAIAFH